VDELKKKKEDIQKSDDNISNRTKKKPKIIKKGK
jgi:hypothetical protein